MKKAIFFVLAAGLAIHWVGMLLDDDGIPDTLAAPAATHDLPGKPGVQYRFARPGMKPGEIWQKGRITVVEFFTTWCPACRSMPENYEYLLEHRPDVSVQRVQLSDEYDFQQAAKDFGINLCSVPHISIFDADGNLVSQDFCGLTDGTTMLFDWINAEIRNGADSRRSG